MSEIDQVHDAEDERQPGRHQEQHDAELYAVEKLLERECHRGRNVMWLLPSRLSARVQPGQPLLF